MYQESVWLNQYFPMISDPALTPQNHKALLHGFFGDITKTTGALLTYFNNSEAHSQAPETCDLALQCFAYLRGMYEDVDEEEKQQRERNYLHHASGEMPKREKITCACH
jgi:hypothetical protein